MNKRLLFIYLLAAVIVLSMFYAAKAQGLKAETVVIESWNYFSHSVEAQNALLEDIEHDYKAHNPTGTVYAPDVRKVQRERRINTWDAIIKEQEFQLRQMKAIREAEGHY
jgi:hypothetical protein